MELQHKESMRSTQQALLEAQSELQTLVQVTAAARAFAAARALMLHSWARSFTQ
jgi:hypothetical protein